MHNKLNPDVLRLREELKRRGAWLGDLYLEHCEASRIKAYPVCWLQDPKSLVDPSVLIHATIYAADKEYHVSGRFEELPCLVFNKVRNLRMES